MLLAAVFITSAAAAEPCQVGVGILQNASQAITGVAARDHLLALLTDEQVVGVPLNAPVPDESMGLEAHRKGCRLLVISLACGACGPGCYAECECVHRSPAKRPHADTAE